MSGKRKLTPKIVFFNREHVDEPGDFGRQDQMLAYHIPCRL